MIRGESPLQFGRRLELFPAKARMARFITWRGLLPYAVATYWRKRDAR